VNPFWSPDGQFLGFFAGARLFKIALSGGPPQPLTDTEGGGAGRTGTWNREGTIVFTPRTILPIHRVSASGGQSIPVTVLNESRQETGHTYPSFLPDGRHFLYLAQSRNPENDAVFVGSLDSTETKFLLQTDSGAVYTTPGYLLFLRRGTLTAQAFNADRLELSGEPFPVAEVTGTDYGQGSPAFSASESGVLAYRSTGRDLQLAWLDREGKQVGTVGPPGEYLNVALSPDERRVVIDRNDATLLTHDLWLYDLARGTASRLTFGPVDESDAVWSPDGEEIVFGSNGASHGLYRKAASGVGEEERLVETSDTTYPRDWSADGRYLLYENPGGTSADLWVLPLFGDRKPIPFLQAEFSEQEGRFSPNGRWIAYTSNEARRREVFVQSFPAGAGKWQISTEGGYVPRWSRDGKELFYIAADGKFMAVPVSAGATFEAGVPKALFQTWLVGFQVGGFNHYAVSADSQRFLMNVPTGEGNKSPITVMVNWLAGIRR
jgi:Tol biopolymer transport system component